MGIRAGQSHRTLGSWLPADRKHCPSADVFSIRFIETGQTTGLKGVSFVGCRIEGDFPAEKLEGSICYAVNVLIWILADEVGWPFISDGEVDVWSMNPTSPMLASYSVSVACCLKSGSGCERLTAKKAAASVAPSETSQLWPARPIFRPAECRGPPEATHSSAFVRAGNRKGGSRHGTWKFLASLLHLQRLIVLPWIKVSTGARGFEHF